MSNLATVTLTVGPNLPPVADDAATVVKAAMIPVLGNDADPEGALSRSEPPARPGPRRRVGNHFVYRPFGPLAGDDSFTYPAADPAGNTATGTVRLTLTDPVAPTLKAVRARYGAAGVADLTVFTRAILPWSGLTRIELAFSEAVTIPAGALTLSGPDGPVPLTFVAGPARGATPALELPSLATGRYTVPVAGRPSGT